MFSGVAFSFSFCSKVLCRWNNGEKCSRCCVDGTTVKYVGGLWFVTFMNLFIIIILFFLLNILNYNSPLGSEEGSAEIEYSNPGSTSGSDSGWGFLGEFMGCTTGLLGSGEKTTLCYKKTYYMN